MSYNKNFSYLSLGENVDQDEYVVTTYYLESDQPDFEKTAEGIAAEASVGTWTDVGTMTEDIHRRLGARVINIEKSAEDTGIVKIAFPKALFEYDNIPQILADVAGNVFGLKEVRCLKVLDIEMPESLVKANLGPYHGIQGIREAVKIADRPLIGTIIKPKIGLSPKEHAKIAYEAWIGGVDLVKDDENLTDQEFNPFYERLTLTLEAKREAEKVTGERKIYTPNVSARVSEMYARAKRVQELGGNAVMVDIITVGFSGIQFLREQHINLIIHGHRAMHGALTHNPKHGIAMLPIARLARLAGIDQLHTGTVIGKMEGNKDDVLEINKFLKSSWFGIKPTMPIASGGLHPGHTAELIKILGNDLIINYGGGIHGHPGGTQKGARAARQALEASMKGVNLREYAKDHEELRQAVDTWGVYGEDLKTGTDTYLHALVESKGLEVQVVQN